MKLPYMTNDFYRYMAEKIPKKLKPFIKTNYNKLNSFIAYGKTDIFTAVDIDINSRCNIKCSYCPLSTFDRGENYMKESLFRKIINDLADFKYEGRISPSFFGEPTLDKRLVELLLFARKKLPRCQLIIHSNGIKLNRNVYRELIDKVKVNGFLITKHLPNFSRSLIEILENEPDVKQFIKLSKINDHFLYNRGGTIENKNINIFKKCFLLSDQIAIDYNGKVTCSNDFFVKEDYGNVNDLHLIYEIWESPKMRERRKRLKEGYFDAEVCKVCSGN